MSMSTSTNMSLTSKTDATDAAEASEPLLRRDDCDSITTLRLNRPRQFNALSDAMLDALQSALDTIAQDDKVRCVVLAAAGKAFCAGHDLREMHSQPDLAYYQALFARCSRVMQAIQALPVPVIAQAHGIATAADCQLVASYDLAIGSSSASFAVSGINAGLFCSTPAVALSRNISAKRAFDMLVTGRSIDAATALDWGADQRRCERRGTGRRRHPQGSADRQQERGGNPPWQGLVLSSAPTGAGRCVCARRRCHGAQHDGRRCVRRAGCLPAKARAGLDFLNRQALFCNQALRYNQ
jgi:enoyl-CoA hydratase/carnithine racemase